MVTPVFIDGDCFGFCASIAHKSDIGGPVPGSCSGQAKEIYNEGLQLPAVRYQRDFATYGDVERIIAANSRTPELVLGDIRGQLGSVRLGEKRSASWSQKHGAEKCRAYFEQVLAVSEQQLRAALAEWPDGRFEAERFVDDDGIDLNKPVRLHVIVEKTGDRIRFDFTGSADQTRGPANIRPPLVEAACAYALISLSDPHTYITSGLLEAHGHHDAAGQRPRPALPGAGEHLQPDRARGHRRAVRRAGPPRAGARPRRRLRQPLDHHRRAQHLHGKGYVQYEIFGGGAGARAGADGASGTTVNQTNAKIAPIEIIESEFPTRLLRFELIRDSGGAGQFRGGLGIRREYLNLEDARFSIRSMKHIIQPDGVAGGHPGRTGDIRINPETEGGEAPALALRGLAAQGRRRVPARDARRRRLRRPARPRSGARAAGRARGLRVARVGARRTTASCCADRRLRGRLTRRRPSPGAREMRGEKLQVENVETV